MAQKQSVGDSNVIVFDPPRALPFSGAWARKAGLDRAGIVAGLLLIPAYFLGAKLGMALTFPPHPVSVMWPTNAILLGAFLLTPVRSWWFLLLCTFPAHLLAELQSGVPLKMVLCWFVSNSSEALIGGVSTRLLLGSSLRFDRVSSLGVLFLCGGLIGPFLSTFMDSAFVSLNHWGLQDYWPVWRTRFPSNVFAAVTIVPFIVGWSTTRLTTVREAKPGRFAEAGVLFAGLLGVSLVVFWLESPGPSTMPALVYAPLPFLVWAAVRFGVAGTSTGILFVALLAIWAAVHGRGPFGSHSPEENALSIQVFFVVVSTTFLSLAASVAERRRAEERFTKAFRSSPDAILISRRKDGHIIEANERWEELFGFGRTETIGRTVSDFNIYSSGADRERVTAGMTAGRPLHDLEMRLYTKAGELRHTLVSADTDEIGGEECLITVLRDISDRKRAEEAQQSLAHASRLAIMGELTAMMAHEVNQPLGAILSNADAGMILLEAKKPRIDKIRKILAEIRNNDLRADEAIRRIRSLLGRHEIQMQPLDLNETVSDVLRLVAGDAMRRQVRLHRELSPGLPPAFGDRVHLQHVLLNLILNAMDAMNETPEPTRVLMVQTKVDGDHTLEVAVADQGPGIGAEIMPRVFESFVTTKKEGMGLGLSIARSIIEAHRGRIWAENIPAGGAIFHFTVPIVENGAGHAARNVA
jgi:PAS domain S-box-containing protein